MIESTDQNQGTSKNFIEQATQILVLLLVSIGVIIGAGLIYVTIQSISLEDGKIDWSKTGQVGDYFGGVVGSIWALAGVLLLYMSLRYQQKELKNNLDEMIEARYESERQTKQFMAQNSFTIVDRLLRKNETEFKSYGPPGLIEMGLPGLSRWIDLVHTDMEALIAGSKRPIKKGAFHTNELLLKNLQSIFGFLRMSCMTFDSAVQKAEPLEKTDRTILRNEIAFLVEKHKFHDCMKAYDELISTLKGHSIFSEKEQLKHIGDFDGLYTNWLRIMYKLGLTA